VRSPLIVITPPSFDRLLGFVKGREPVQVQALITERPVESLDLRIVRRLAWLAEVDPSAVMIGPEIHEMAGKFHAVVGKEISRCRPRSDQTIKRCNDVLTAQSLSNVSLPSIPS